MQNLAMPNHFGRGATVGKRAQADEPPGPLAPTQRRRMRHHQAPAEGKRRSAFSAGPWRQIKPAECFIQTAQTLRACHPGTTCKASLAPRTVRIRSDV